MLSAELPPLGTLPPFESPSLEHRIALLERENQRLTHRVAFHARIASRLLILGGLSALVLGLAGAAASQGVPLVLQTKRLELLNDAGKVVLLAKASFGGGELELYDAMGRQVLRLSSPSGGGSFELFDDRGQPVLSAVGTSAGALIKTSSAKGEPQLEIAPRGEGVGLRLSSPGGPGGIELTSGPLGGALVIQGTSGSPLLTAEPLEAGFSLTVRGQPEAPAVVLDTSGEPTIALRAPSGSDLVAARSGPDGGELQVANLQGQQVFSAKTPPSMSSEPPPPPAEDAGQDQDPRKGKKKQR